MKQNCLYLPERRWFIAVSDFERPDKSTKIVNNFSYVANCTQITPLLYSNIHGKSVCLKSYEPMR